jgi:hypothetical protein
MKRFLKWAGYLLLFIVIFTVAGFLAWDSVSYFIAGKVAQFYARRADIVLDIGGVRGRPFSETTVENISVRPAEEKVQGYHFKSQSITCTYNLWDLKKGYGFFLQGLSCRADSPEFVHDLSVNLPEDKAEAELKTFLLPAVLPGLKVYNGTLILTHTGWDIDLRGLNANLRSSGAVHELLLDVEGFRLNQGGVTRIDTNFTSSLHYTEAKITVDSLEMGAEGIKVNGLVNLPRLDRDYFEFAADVTFTQSQLGLKGSWANQLLQTHVRTDNFDIGELQQRLGGAGWDISGKIKAEADLAFNLETLEELNGSFAAEMLDGKLHGVDVESVAAAGSFDHERFRLSVIEGRTTGNHVLVKDVSIPLSLLQKGEILSILGETQAKLSGDVANVGELLNIAGIKDDVLPASVRPESLAIRGHLDKGVLFVDTAEAAAADSRLKVDRAVIPIPATPEAIEKASLDLQARLETGKLGNLAALIGAIPLDGEASADLSVSGSIREPKVTINFDGDYLNYRERQIGSLVFAGYLRFTQEKLWHIKSIDFEITELIQENGSGVLTLLSPVTGKWQEDSLLINGTFHLDNKGEIAAGISRAPGKEVALEISTRSLDSDGWLGNYIAPGFFFHGADIEAVLLGVFENTQLQLSGSVSEAGATDVDFPLTGSFNLHYSSKGIEIEEFTWRSMERNQLTITGFVPYDPMAPAPLLDNEMSIKGHIDFPVLEDIGIFLEPWGISKGSVTLDMDVTGSWDRPEGHVHLEAKGIEPPGTLRQHMDSTVDFSCDIAALGGIIALQAANLDSSAYSAQAKGSWKHGISVKELLQNRRAELKGEVAADATVRLKDLNFLRRKLPWLRRLEGDMRGELHISGQVTKPVLKGSFFWVDGEASHTFNFPMLTAINLEGDFNERSITITDMQAEVGGSPVDLKGKVTREQERIDVSLQINGSNLLLFRNNDMRLRGDVQLDVAGPLERLVVKGKTGLTGGYYTRDLDFLGMIGSSSTPVSEGVSFLFSFADPPLRDDIRITTIEPFRIRNNLIRGVLRPELTLKGTGELPFLVGAIYIDPSRVLLPSGRLQVQSGLLRFLEGEPDRPQLDLLAHSKVLGYEINVVTQGPLDDPVVTLSSSPALPNEDLLLLLLTGQPPRQDATGSLKNRATTNVMVYLGRDFLNRWLEDEPGVSDETILDRFELDFGRDVTKSGEQTIESSFRLSEQATGTGKVYYLTGGKDKYDAYNYGLKLVFRFE